MAQTADVSRYARAESAVFDLSFESFPRAPARLRRPKSALTESHFADFDRAERADIDGNWGHLTASMDSP